MFTRWVITLPDDEFKGGGEKKGTQVENAGFDDLFHVSFNLFHSELEPRDRKGRGKRREKSFGVRTSTTFRRGEPRSLLHPRRTRRIRGGGEKKEGKGGKGVVLQSSQLSRKSVILCPA